MTIQTMKTTRKIHSDRVIVGQHYYEESERCVVTFVAGRVDSKGEPSSVFVASIADYIGADSLPRCDFGWKV